MRRAENFGARGRTNSKTRLSVPRNDKLKGATKPAEETLISDDEDTALGEKLKRAADAAEQEKLQMEAQQLAQAQEMARAAAAAAAAAANIQHIYIRN